MSKAVIISKASRAFNKVGFTLKKRSPEILAVAGTVGVITSGVMACKATTKVSKIIEERNAQLEQVHDYVDEKGFTAEYSEDDNRKDIAIIHTQAGFKMVKLYAPAVTIGVLSLAALLGSNQILRKRNVALGAAYTALDRSFKKYRNAVIDRFGEELDKELKYGLKAEKVEKEIVDENGKKKKVDETVSVVDPNNIDDTSRIFYEGNKGWDPDPQYTLSFLKRQQSYASDRLKAQGFLFLNDVYEMLGFSKTKEGQLIGWIYDEKNPIGDNFVDFGIYDIHNDAKIRFVNGDERAILLEFNHDGYILEKM